jgi:biopolymer transport protein ExbB/TolQ
MGETSEYRPLTAYFGWSLIALGLWLAVWSALRHRGITFPAADTLPPDDQVLRFLLRLIASDFQCGMAVLFLGTLFYAAAQFAAVLRDEKLAKFALAKQARHDGWWSAAVAIGAGREAAFWSKLGDRLAAQPPTSAGARSVAGMLNEHIRFGGAAAMMPLRFALWLFPMLGFLGTVVGLSFAVNDLAVMVTGDAGGGLRDPKFKDVLGNLHLAFDTTIQGIIFAIVVILLLAALDLLWQRFSHRVELIGTSPQNSADAMPDRSD